MQQNPGKAMPMLPYSLPGSPVMSDFEKAAERLRVAKLNGTDTRRDRASEFQPDDSDRSLAGLKRMLLQKTQEPPDIVLDTDAPDSNAHEVNGAIDTTLLDLSTTEVKNNSGTPDLAGHVSAAAHTEQAAPEKSLSLSFSSMAAKGFITPDTPKGRLTEEYRRIKRPLLKHMHGASSGAGSRLNVIMVTSSVQGEGKTYNAINLAISLAKEKNHSVLLIDADVVKGTAGRELGVSPDEPGLLDLLSQNYSQPSQLIMNTNIPRLAFMPAGQTDEQANELLTSGRMRSYIDKFAMESAERIIVLDCPPILQTNEANVLAEYAGQIVFIVAEQQTSQSLVQEALSYLDEDKYVGLLLNKSTRAGAGYGYGYGY